VGVRCSTAVSWLVLATTTACGSTGTVGPEAPLALPGGLLEVAASSPEFRTNQTVDLTVRLVAADGSARSIPGSQFVWTSSDPTVLFPQHDGRPVAGRAGVATLTVSYASSVTTIALRVAGQPQSTAPFRADVRLPNDAPTTLRMAAAQAVARWERLVAEMPAGRLGQRFGGWNCAGTSMPATSDTIATGILVVITLDSLGGSTLASTTPCAFRDGPSRLPGVAVIRLDAAFIRAMSDAGRVTAIENVLAHEFAHALGFGAALPAIAPSLMAAGSDAAFTGSGAREAFGVLGGRRWTGVPVPFETTPGLGSMGHWRRAALAGEVMTATLTAIDVRAPISAITLGALADLGYRVDLAAAEPYVVPSPVPAAFATR